MADEETWSKRVAEWRESGLTAGEFCAGREFTVTGLYWWSSNLRRVSRRNRARPVRLARVVRRPSEETPAEQEPASEDEPPLVMIEIADVRVFVTAGVERATLCTVLGALEERASGAAR